MDKNLTWDEWKEKFADRIQEWDSSIDRATAIEYADASEEEYNAGLDPIESADVEVSYGNGDEG